MAFRIVHDACFSVSLNPHEVRTHGTPYEHENLAGPAHSGSVMSRWARGSLTWNDVVEGLLDIVDVQQEAGVVRLRGAVREQ